MMVHNRLAGTAMGSAEKNVSVALGLKKKRESYMRRAAFELTRSGEAPENKSTILCCE